MNEQLIPAYIRSAVINQRIYPSGSPIVERGIAQIFQSIDEFLKQEDRLTVTENQGKVLIKGKDVPDAAALGPIMQEHAIQSVTFQRGLTLPEVKQMVVLLSLKKLPDENAAEWLQKQQVTHISIDKSKLVELFEGEIVLKRVDQLFSGAHDFIGVVSALRESYDMMDKAPGDREKNEIQEHVARRMASMEPSLLRDIMENELPKRVEESGLKQMTLNAITQDKMKDIFSEIGNWYKQVREETQSEFEVVEHLNKLKDFLKKLLTAPASKEVPFVLYQELMEQGILSEIPPEIRKESDDNSLILQVDKLVEGPASGLLEMPTREQLPAMVRKLCDLGLEELSRKLVQKLLENLKQSSPVIRQMSLRLVVTFYDICKTNRKEALLTTLAKAVEPLLDTERSEEVYKEISVFIDGLVRYHLIEGRYVEAGRLLAILRRHTSEYSQFIVSRQEISLDTIKKIASGTLDVLSEDMLKGAEDKQEGARYVLSQMGEAAIPFFIRIIRRSPELRQRKMAAGMLKSYGDAGRKAILDELTVGNSSEALLNVFSVVDDFLGPATVSALEIFIHHPDAASRKWVIQLLGKVKDVSSVKLLIKFLIDPDEAVLLSAIRELGALKSVEAVDPLLDVLKNPSVRVQEEACLALGQIADPRSVPALDEMVGGRSGGLFRRKTTVDETVRVKAVWALSRINTAESIQALQNVAGDSNLQIQAIVKTVLKG
ncbi:MAG TPA: HEAT repeat domain-containing protein [Elusimicrobiota bacterium]|nr:HEAT repeat domain-containing protein [Elusimicrobiota bacterium]